MECMTERRGNWTFAEEQWDRPERRKDDGAKKKLNWRARRIDDSISLAGRRTVAVVILLYYSTVLYVVGTVRYLHPNASRDVWMYNGQTTDRMRRVDRVDWVDIIMMQRKIPSGQAAGPPLKKKTRTHTHQTDSHFCTYSLYYIAREITVLVVR